MLISPDPCDCLRVVLVSTRNPLNIGAAARAMQNFGFRRLRVVNPYAPAFREARSAVGASAVLEGAEEFKTIAHAIADCTLVVGTTAASMRQADHSIVSLEHGARMIIEAIGAGDNRACAAILFGSEKFGLSNNALSYCHWRMQIPTEPEQPSMNLGQAVAVCLYELARGTSLAPDANPSSAATADQLELADAVLIETLQLSGYFAADLSADQKNKVRRMVRRFNLSSEDATHLLGMLRQILWKLKNRG